MIVESHGYKLLTVKVHNCDHVYVFVSAKPSVRISDVVCVLKSNFACLLFGEFLQVKLKFRGGHLWFWSYAVHTAGVVNSEKIEEYITRP